jgi:hypothetical protein
VTFDPSTNSDKHDRRTARFLKALRRTGKRFEDAAELETVIEQRAASTPAGGCCNRMQRWNTRGMV